MKSKSDIDSGKGNAIGGEYFAIACEKEENEAG